MRLRRIIGVIMTATMCISLMACGQIGGAGNQTESQATERPEDMPLTEKTFTPSAENVKIIGRAGIIEDGLWMVHSASGGEFTFLGTKAEITLQSDSTMSGDRNSQARVAIFVNDECVVDEMMSKLTETYTVYESETAAQCTIRVVKLSESAQSTAGVTSIKVTSQGDIYPTPRKDKYIEFIGDSITCGYGVEDENRDHHFSTTTENAMKAYAYKTAQLLDADYSLVSFSGYGIVSGYSNDGNKVPEQSLPQYYEKLGFSYGAFAGQSPQNVDWDFSKREPDVIVINLGTNDESYTKSDSARRQEYVDGYVEFLKQVRKNNPNAKIFATLGIMGDALYTSVDKAVGVYIKETGDENVQAMRFVVQNQEDGYAADWHPTEKTHTKAADRLAGKIAEAMGWEVK